ncbi:ATP-grasp domain-containing protein [Candidatus Uhrbacteria bacterium]|nr:ATP-grasp domain-containing protein [Candidatus Uhrbacteria bacterium]
MKTLLIYRSCLDCDPLPSDARHVSDRVMQHVDRCLDALFFPLKRLLFFKKIENAFTPVLLRACIFFHIFKESEITEELEPQIYNRTLVVFREAQKRGMPMKVFLCRGRCTKFFSLELAGKKIVFDELPAISLRGDDVPFSDKFVLKQALKKHNLPTPDGMLCKTVNDAVAAADNLGYPVVVKPRCGSLSKHTTCNITHGDDLRHAVKSAKMIANECIVERYIDGCVFRITVIGGVVAGCCLREAPNVVGDEIQNIHELVAKKNTDPRRGSAHQKNTTLHHVSLSCASAALLASRGMTPDSVPRAGEKVYLHAKVILGAGADIHDRTDEMHPENKKLFEDAAKIWDAPLVGFDALFQDVSKSWRDQKCGIIEANSKPYIDMHHVPVSGQPRNIAKLLIDYILKTI